MRGKDVAAGVKMVRVRSEKIKNHNRWFNRKQVKRQIFKENQENNKKVDNEVIKTAECNFFKKEIWKEDGGLVDSIEDFNRSCNNEFFTDNAVIDSNVSAQFLRYSTEAVLDSKAVLNKDNVDLKIGAKATANFTAAAAQGVFQVQVPDENGFGIMQFLKEEAPAFVDDDFTEVFFKVILQTSGNAFVGACASVSTDLGLKCSRGERPEAVAQAGVELFAGAKVQADATFAVDTMFVDDEKMDDMRAVTQTVGERGDKIVSAKDIEDKKIAKWERLCELSAGAYAAAGWGVDAVFKLGYEKEHFRFQAKIGATVKLGAGSFLNGKIAPVLVGKFVLTIANGFNWKGISGKLDEKVHLLYHSILSNCFYLNEKVEVVYGQFLNHIDKVMNIIKNLDGFEGHGLKILKIVDDDLDKKLPGYTSFKQYNMGFIILRGAYNIYKDINTKNRAIYLVLKAKNDKTRWNYATWQMKVNLIYDMRKGISDYVDDYSDEQRGEAVLTVLKSARNKDEFRKIIKGLKTPQIGMDSINITDLMTKEQILKYEAIKF